jgi:hypothetical protein
VNPQRVPLPCGCAVIASHARGDLLVTCKGSDGSMPEGVRSISRNGLETCAGGRSYAIAAEEVRTIRYTARPVTVRGGGAA